MKTISKWIIGLMMLAMAACQSGSEKQLKLFPLFSHNMVLQREIEIPVWGEAPANSNVEVLFREQKVSTKADKAGKWMVRLQPENIGFGDSMVVTAKDQRVVFYRVAVGEVWIASGQSNMEMPMMSNWAKLNNAEEEVANANYMNLRICIVNRNTATSPIDTIMTDGWKMCTSETVKDFSAVAYFFGRELLQYQTIPVGIIQTAWGGTIAEAWTSAESLKLMQDFAGEVAKIEAMPTNVKDQEKQYEADFKTMQTEMAEADPGISGTDTLYAATNFDHSAWMEIDLPALWENTPFGAFDGSVWFRKTIEVPADLAGKSLTLNVAPSDDHDQAWVNGVCVGKSGQWGVPRNYAIPAGIVKAGKNVITLRVSDYQGAGGFNGKTEDFTLSATDGTKMDISKGWKMAKGYNHLDIKTKPQKPGEPNRPTVLYNAMIKPLIPYAIKGVIWYQGESNAGRAFQYRELFKTMITDWRTQWNQGDFPFYFVQLAAHMQRNTEPVEDMWAELREAQMMALQLPNTGMAVAIDLGDANDIHPGNKQDVGKRLALWALNKNYGFDIQYSGPLYQSFTTEGNKMTLEFSHSYDGLKTSDGQKLTGFAIAGSDGKFIWANAEIKGSKVVVWSPQIAEPVAVRYAWSANPACNLINSAGLPASPFRTDDFEPITK